ncbi:MAG: protein kinase [Acidobacteria bacterium]|nr:protein kinase [Acidobacteriota bacterium]
MTPERYRQVQAILDAALELDAAERAALLDRECAGDAELRREAESLLAHDEQAAGFLEGGHMLGPFRVLHAIDHGGMGAVYLAQDTRLGRNVALKLLPRELAADPGRLRRFEQEVRALAALNHPNIVTILDSGQAGEHRYLATELVEGETLRRRIRRGRMEASDALAIAVQVAEAVAVAHAAGLIHRDLKPENIMLRPDGYVKLLDFGIAKVMPAADGAEVSALTSTGLILGTVQYMPPEQARGLAVDERADVFSLGVVLYEMLAGRPPFEGATMADVFAALLEHRHAPLGAPALDRILDRALAKRPEDRYRTMAAMRADLASARLRPGRRHIRWWIAAAVSAVALTAIWVWRPMRTGEPAFRIVQERAVAQARHGAISPDGKYLALIREDRREDRDMETLLVRQLSDSAEILALGPGPVAYRGLAFSPDSRRLYFRNEAEAGALYVVAVPGTAPRRIGWAASAVTFSPDGKRIAFVRQCALLVANADASNERRMSDGCFDGDPAWSPAGDAILCPARVPGGVRLERIAVKDGSRAAIGPARWSRITGIIWRGGTPIVSANDSFGWPSQFWRLAGSAEQLTEGSKSYDILGAAGTTLLAVRTTVWQNLWTIPPVTPIIFGAGVYLEPASAEICAAHGSLGSDIFSADRVLTENAGANGFPVMCGSYVVFTSTRTGIPRVWRMDPDGSRPTPLSGDIAAMKADCAGDSVVFESDPPGSLWKAPLMGGVPVRLLDRPCRRPTVSPDGKWIVCGSGENQVELVPATGGEPRRFFDLPIDPRTYPRWKPDGRAIDYVRTVHGVSNIWRQSLEGGPAVQLTDFSDGRITDFARGLDGRLVCARGRERSDLVLLTLAQ